MNKGKPTLKWDLENGEGSIGNLDSFREFDPIMRLDLLKDWINDLQEEYNFTLEKDFVAWGNKIRAKAGHAPQELN